MKKVTLWSLAVLLILLLYLAATIAFTLIFQEVSVRRIDNTRTPQPTFISAPAEATDIVIVPTPQPVVPTITPTATPPPADSPSATPAPTEIPSATPSPTPVTPQLLAATTVNIRQGPGTNYPVVGSLLPNLVVSIIGQNPQGSWWQIAGPTGESGWVADSVVEATNTASVPIGQAPPPPVPPTPTPVPQPTRPAHQYEPSGWFDDTNHGLTRFLGTITDLNGTPVNGVRVEAQCGGFRVISNPSGPVGDGYFNESNTWPDGFYDLTVDNKPRPCKWFLTVVETTPDGDTVIARLSEDVEIEVTYDSSIVTANWRKNW